MSRAAAMDASPLTIAIVGATGAVGEALLSVLTERGFPIAKVHALGSGRSDDDTVMFAERPLRVGAVADFDFSGCQLAFFCAPAAVAKQHAPRAAAAGCWVIDTSAQFRLDPVVPLIVPTVNGEQLAALARPQIIASPSAPVVQLGTVLAPLAAAAGLQRVDVTTLLSVSALGKAAVAELAGQTAKLLNVQAIKQKLFPSQIAFNLLPAFDAPGESGYTLEELNTATELRKLLAQEALEVDASEIFAAVFYGHSQSLKVALRQPLTIDKARKLLKKSVDIEFARADELATPVDLGTGSDRIVVGRIAQTAAEPTRLMLWSVADNIRKGAAVNIVAIAETLLKSHL